MILIITLLCGRYQKVDINEENNFHKWNLILSNCDSGALLLNDLTATEAGGVKHFSSWLQLRQH